MKKLLFAVIVILFAGSRMAQAQFVFSGGDGSSMEKAIVIKGAKNEMAGVAAEDVWLVRRYPSYKKTAQALFESKGKQYDKIDFTTVQKEKKSVYFDITDFFAKTSGMWASHPRSRFAWERGSNERADNFIPPENGVSY